VQNDPIHDQVVGVQWTSSLVVRGVGRGGGMEARGDLESNECGFCHEAVVE
jgi:hypothetical protein